jgi:hypothetical protein
MTHALGSLTATRHKAKRLASGGGHAHKPHPTATRPRKEDVGKVQVFLRAGTVLSMPKGPLPASYLNACTQAPGGPQVFRVTFTMLDGRHRAKSVVSSGEALFRNLPIGRYRVDVENVSGIPSLPDAIAEVLVRRAKTVRLDVVHSTDTLGAVGDTCGFRVGSFAPDPSDPYADAQRAELNATALGVFWPEFLVGDAVVQPGSVAPLTDSNARAIAAQPGQIAVIDKATRRPLTAGGAVVYGQRDNPATPTQLALVTANGQPAPIPPGTVIRFRPQAPTPNYTHFQYTPIVWKAFGYPPDWDDKHPITGSALRAKILNHVEETLSLLPERPGDQFVLVNETLKGRLGWSDLLGRGSLGNRFTSGGIEKNHRALLSWLSRHPSDREELFARCLAQNHHEGRWLHYLHDHGPTYIRESFERAHATRPDGVYIVNDYGVESLAYPKAVALIVLAAYVKQKLGAATHKLGVGLQMHLTQDTVPYQPLSRRHAFLRGLRSMLTAVASIGANLYVTEMAARMPGPLSIFEARRSREDLHEAILQMSADIAANDGEANALATKLGDALGFSKIPHEAPGATYARLVAQFESHADRAAGKALNAEIAKEQHRENAAAKRHGRRAERVHFSEDQKGAFNVGFFKHLLGLFPSDKPWSNVRIWQGDPAYLASIQPLPKPSARDHKVQKEVFRDVALTCLSAHNCNDLNFWEMFDRPWADDRADLLGHACDLNVGGPGPNVTPPSLSWRRKPAYYGALQGAIEAALVKHRLNGYAHSQNRTARTCAPPRFAR